MLNCRCEKMYLAIANKISNKPVTSGIETGIEMGIAKSKKGDIISKLLPLMPTSEICRYT